MGTVLITGATDGLGRYLTKRLAADGLRVLAHGRSSAKLDAVVAEAGGDVVPVRADLASLREVDQLADQVLAATDRLDVLVSNAGVGFGTGTREESADGIELRFAVNYLAGYRLTRKLLALLRSSAPARIVNVASAGQEAIDFDDPMLTSSYDGTRAYRQAKLAQVMSTVDLAAELADSGVTVNALHPATFMNTTMVVTAGVSPMSTVEQGGEATLRLIRDPSLDGVTGRYFNGTHEARALAQAYDPRAREQLRALTEQLLSRASLT